MSENKTWFWASAGANYPTVNASDHLAAVEALSAQVTAGNFPVPTYCFVAPEDVYLWLKR